MFADMQHLLGTVVSVTVSGSTEGQPSPALQRVADELSLVGLQQFTTRYPRHKSDDLLLRLGQSAVWSTSIATAVVASTGLRLIAPEPPQDSTRVLYEHGIDPLKLAHPKRPEVGDQFLKRADIQRVYGGNGVAGIVHFRDDDVVNCFSDDKSGSYADDPPTPLKPFGYRGDGRSGDQEFVHGNRRLEAARANKSAIRYWHRPTGGSFTFLFWCVVIGRYWGRGVDRDGLNRKEIVWLLHRVADPQNAAVPSHIQDIGDAETANMDAGPGPEVKEDPSYAELRTRAVDRPAGESHRQAARLAPIRNRYARLAVLVRAQNKCEATWCTQMPFDQLPNGDAILEVDHVDDLARLGADVPSNMIALCPNCHASKTRGRNAATTRNRLRKIAAAKDLENWAKSSGN
jgi:5-methylcytosine-specific restriction protein A